MEKLNKDDKILIAQAEQKDFVPIMQLAENHHRESVFGSITFSQKKFKKVFDQCMEGSPRHLGLKAEIDGKVVGFLYCTLGEYFIGEGALVASVNVFFVGEDVRGTLAGGKVGVKLVGGVKKWAKAHEAHSIMFCVTTGVEAGRADKFFRRLGAQTLGGNYVVQLCS